MWTLTEGSVRWTYLITVALEAELNWTIFAWSIAAVDRKRKRAIVVPDIRVRDGVELTGKVLKDTWHPARQSVCCWPMLTEPNQLLPLSWIEPIQSAVSFHPLCWTSPGIKDDYSEGLLHGRPITKAPWTVNGCRDSGMANRGRTKFDSGLLWRHRSLHHSRHRQCWKK